MPVRCYGSSRCVESCSAATGLCRPVEVHGGCGSRFACSFILRWNLPRSSESPMACSNRHLESLPGTGTNLIESI